MQSGLTIVVLQGSQYLKYHNVRRRRAYELKVDPAFIDFIYGNVEKDTASLCDVSVVAGEGWAMSVRFE